MNEDMKKLKEIVEHFDDAMLISRDPAGGSLSGRPMRIANDDAFPKLTFVAAADSGKVEGISQDPQVTLTLQGDGKFASISGKASVNADRDRLRELWNSAWDLWFEGGPETTNAVLIDVDILSGDYWDMSGTNRIRFAIEAGKALLQDRTIDPEAAGEHGTATVRAAG